MKFISVVCLLCSSQLLHYTSADLEQCGSNVSPPVQVSVNGKRNQTGHWITQVSLQQNYVKGQRATAVDVKHTSSSCEGGESSLNVVLTFTAPPPRVGGDYELFAGIGYYKFHNVPMTFPLARQACEDEGAHLAVINSEMESKVMVTLFSRFKVLAGTARNLAWVGVQRIGDEWFSIFGERLNETGFARWSPGEPQNGGEYCGLVYRANGGFHDHRCDFSATFICEQEI